MTSLIFDIETNGFLDVLDRVHCNEIEDTETGEVFSYGSGIAGPMGNMEESVRRLEAADVLIGHNIIKFDLPAIAKVYPWFKPKGRVIDTMVLSRKFWPELKKTDAAMRINNPSFPGKLVGSHKLEAFGYRLDLMKGEFNGPWEEWTPEMQVYCAQDRRVNVALWRKQLIRWYGGDNKPSNFVPYSDESVTLEMDVAKIVARQERRGVAFDEEGAAKLYVKLSQKREELETQLTSTFTPWFKADGKKDFIPKKDNAKQGYTAGAPLRKIKLVEFNPKSRDHIASRLMAIHGWVPVEFTDDGKPKVDDTVMSKLPYPEAPLLSEYLMVQKRIGQLAEGKEAWLKHVKNGAIHGGVNTCGAVTRRMTHMFPNLAQAPTVEKPYGPEMRGLFVSRKGYLLLGCDADSLEGRMLAGYMAPFDGGAYIETILRGKAADGTDTHSVNARALGMDPKAQYLVDGELKTGRSIAKTWFYAFMYGGGAEKLGWILGKRGDPTNPAHWAINKRSGERVDKYASKYGTKSKEDFAKNLPALGALIEAIKKKATRRGYLLSIDKGKLTVRKAHAALNTLLQSAGAIFMKKALVILDNKLQLMGLVPGIDYEFVLNIHDEWQIEVKPEYAEEVGREAEEAISLAGRHWNFPCPLVGNAHKKDGRLNTGRSWAETH